VAVRVLCGELAPEPVPTIVERSGKKVDIEMTDDASLAKRLAEHVLLLVAENRELRNGRGSRKRKGRTPRPLARKGSVESVLIRLRGQLVRRHERGGFSEVPISSSDLLDIHARQGGLCSYTSVPYEVPAEEPGPLSVTVDRLDMARGWTRENVVLCCLFAGVARNGWPLELVVPLWRFLPKAPGMVVHYRPGKEPISVPL